MENKIEPDDFSTRPLRTFCAISLACLVTVYWDRYCFPVRCYLWERWEPTSSRNNRLPSILDSLWRGFRLTLLCSLTSPALLWVLVYSLCSPTTKPLFIYRIKVTVMLDLALLLARTLLDFWDRLTGRHDSPVVEPQGFYSTMQHLYSVLD